MAKSFVMVEYVREVTAMKHCRANTDHLSIRSSY